MIDLKSNFKASYDAEKGILYLAKEGEEQEVVKIAPGVNAELDASGNLTGVELFNASHLLKDAMKPLENKLVAA